MAEPQGPQKWHIKFLNFFLCASNDPNEPKKTCRRKCIDCLKPNTDEQEQGLGPERESWGNRCTFFITTLGMAVGLGQVWRFPTLAYAKGGGAFLIMYGVVIFLFGNALFFFEVSNGQYTSKNPLRVYDKVPFFQGVGWSMIAYSFLFCTYYSHMVSFSFYYLFHSFRMPWGTCPSYENDDFFDNYTCMHLPKLRKPDLDGVVCGFEGIIYNRTKLCQNSEYAKEQRTLCCTAANVTDPKEYELYFNTKELCRTREYPILYYWNHVVNRVYRENDPSYGYLGEVNPHLLGFSFLTWTIALVILYKGLKSLGVLMYIMVPLPYIVLIIMFGFVVSQKGATMGLKKFFIPKAKSFINLDIWRVAAEQAFYSIGVGMGPLITFGSYSRFKSPSHIDGILICLCIFLTSILCSLVVFSVLGFLSVKGGIPFEEVCDIGPGLVFITYPQSLELLPAATFFSILFYLMLINLGLSSVTGIIETVSSAIYDIWPLTRRYKYLVNMGVLISSFLIGIPMTARGGLAVYDAFDTFSAGIPLIPLCALEMLAVIYIYNIGRFCEDINFMLGFYPNRYYRYNWILGPVILFAIFIAGLVKLKIPFQRPWLKAVGWLLFIFVMIWIFIGAFYNIAIYRKQHKLKEIFKPPPDHGPKKEADREARKTFSVKRKIF